MVALAILAGALLALSDVVAGALRNHVRARDLEVDWQERSWGSMAPRGGVGTGR
jgi:hypothetical protein